PSQMYLMPLSSVIEEYNRKEGRNLKSIPLKLTDREKTDFLDHVKETLWSYAGDYKFLTNNCSTEAKDFLKGVVSNPVVEKLTSFSPTGLYDDLAKTGLLDKAFEKSNEPGYVFKAYGKMQLEAFNEIQQFAKKSNVKSFLDRDCMNLNHYIRSTSANQRLALYSDLMDIQDSQGRLAPLTTPAQFFILEDEIMRYQKARYSSESLRFLQTLNENPEIKKATEKELDINIESKVEQVMKIFQENQAFQGQGTLGYGVPLSNEKIKELSSTDNMIQALNMRDLAEDFKKIEDHVAKKLMDIRKESSKSRALYETFGGDILGRPSIWIQGGSATAIERVRGSKEIIRQAIGFE
ncbi:MAG: DUF4105 domain-containing protein, partial [Bdellovibrionota bacterium]